MCCDIPVDHVASLLLCGHNRVGLNWLVDGRQPVVFVFVMLWYGWTLTEHACKMIIDFLFVGIEKKKCKKVK